jgi:hypothetical protein
VGERLRRSIKAEMVALLIDAYVKAMAGYEFMTDQELCRAWRDRFDDRPLPRSRKPFYEAVDEEILSE